MNNTLVKTAFRKPCLSALLRTGAFSAVSLIALSLSSKPAFAQAHYQYTGNPFTLFSCGPNSSDTATQDCSTPGPNANTSYTTTDHVTATLTFSTPLAAGLNYVDVTSLAGFLLTMNDGHQTLSSATSLGLIAKVSTDGGGQIIGPWLLVLNLGNAADSGIASENEPPVQPFVQDTGTLACCDPAIPGDLAINQNAPGTWGSGLNPATMVANLITTVQGMKIPQQGSSLIDQLQQVETDVNTQNGRACQDINIFAAHVTAQTGKKITTAQAKQIQAAVASIEAALKCGA